MFIFHEIMMKWCPFNLAMVDDKFFTFFKAPPLPGRHLELILSKCDTVEKEIADLEITQLRTVSESKNLKHFLTGANGQCSKRRLCNLFMVLIWLLSTSNVFQFTPTLLNGDKSFHSWVGWILLQNYHDTAWFCNQTTALVKVDIFQDEVQSSPVCS